MAKTGERPKILIDRSINIFGRDYQELSVKIVDRQIAYQTDDDDDDDKGHDTNTSTNKWAKAQ